MPPQDEVLKTEQEKMARAILRYIEMRIIGKNATMDEETEKDIREYYQTMSPREKADILYEKLTAYTLDKQAQARKSKEAKQKGEKFAPEEAEAELISEIKVLFSDEPTKALFSHTYGEARADAKIYRLSELGKGWLNLNKQIQETEEKFRRLEQDLFLEKIEGKGKISSARSQTERLANRLLGLRKQRDDLKNLEGVPNIRENTDAAANFQYETLKNYRKQLKKGFVWLPSRDQIHRQTIAALQNGRWPVLIGEAGTGKSDQADAAAIELTGNPPTEIECEANTSEKQLIKDSAIDPKSGGSYEEYGPLMQAFTGYEDSRQKEPKYTTGRIARFDESGRLGPKAYAIIKKTRQKKSGEDFYGHQILTGAAAIWTSNPIGPRYPDRRPVDPAMRREIAEIYVDYPEMSKENPELYDFMLTALLDENDLIAIAKKELAPAYEKKEIPKDVRETLQDGSVIVAEDELLEDSTDRRHGTCWRLANAIKTLQNSFVYGNEALEDALPNDTLRFKEDNEGNLEITKEEGELLTLSSSTITLGEIASWMGGFKERLQKQDRAFQTSSFSDWIKFKINTYLKQADKGDRKKVEAIFNYFHLLDPAPDLVGAKPITPKEIGYLSPCVPRPAYIEKSKIETSPLSPDAPFHAEAYETTQVLLENGEKVLIKTGDFTFETALSGQTTISPGRQFMIEGKSYVFAGVAEEQDPAKHGKLAGSLLNEKELHKLFIVEEVEEGILKHDIQETGGDVEYYVKSL